MKFARTFVNSFQIHRYNEWFRRYDLKWLILYALISNAISSVFLLFYIVERVNMKSILFGFLMSYFVLLLLYICFVGAYYVISFVMKGILKREIPSRYMFELVLMTIASIFYTACDLYIVSLIFHLGNAATAISLFIYIVPLFFIFFVILRFKERPGLDLKE